MRNNGSTLVPVTHRIFDPPSTRRAPARGTSAHGQAGDRAGESQRDAGVAFAQWAAATTTTTDRAAASRDIHRMEDSGWLAGGLDGTARLAFLSLCRPKPRPCRARTPALARANPETQ
jgi:hypothetical protein